MNNPLFEIVDSFLKPLTDEEKRQMRREERRFNIIFFTILILTVLGIFGAGFGLAWLMAVPK
jgi:hypothetical protein